MRGLKYALIPILLLAIIIGSIVFSIYKPNEVSDIWKIIPQNALLISEISNDELISISNSFGSTLSDLSVLNDVKAAYSLFDSLFAEKDDQSLKINKSHKLYFSVHEIGKEHLGVIYYLPLSVKSIEELIFQSKGKYDIKISQRSYQKENLYEISHKEYGNATLTIKNGWVAISRESLLVEDMIRQAEKTETETVKDQHTLLFNVGEKQVSEFRIFILVENFSIFLRKLNSNTSQQIESFIASMGLADVSVSGTEWRIGGYFENKFDQYLLKHLQINKPVKPEVFPLIPVTTTTVQFFGFNSGFELYYQLFNADTSKAYHLREGWKSLREDLYYEPLSLFESFRNQVVLLETIQENSEQANSHILLIKIDKEISEKAISKFENQISLIRKDTTYYEIFQEYIIRQLDYEEIPARLLGPIFLGFEECFYTYHNDYLIFSSSIPSLKKWITSVELQSTWDRDIFYRSFSENTITRTNYFYYSSPNNHIQKLIKKEETPLIAWIKNNTALLEKLNHFCFQISFNPGVLPYFSASTLIDTSRNIIASSTIEETGQITTLQNTLVGKPTAYKSSNNERYILTADSVGNIYKISEKGEILWAFETGSSVSSDLLLLNRGSNRGSVVYLSKGKIHGLDANGVSLDGFPISPEHFSPTEINLIDYDNSGVYRIALADQRGKAMLMDFTGKGLEGWNPISYEHRLLAAPQHLRIKGKDLLVCVTSRGLISVYNRRGEIQKGFPLDLGANFSSKPILRTGSALSNSTINLVSELGEYYRVTLDGKILMKEILLRSNRFSQFKLVPSDQKDNWMICRANLSTLTFFSENAESKLEAELPISGNLFYQYFEPKSGKFIIAVIDMELGLSYLLDQEGRMMGLPTYEMVSGFDLYLENKILTIYLNQGRNLKKLQLSYN